MKMNNLKIAAYLWITGSVLISVAILLFVLVFQSGGESDAERTSQLVDKWVLASSIWRLETIAAILLAVSSWYFASAKQSISWFFIAFGHILMVVMYANMLGSYPVAAEFHHESPHLFPMVNNTAVWIFGVSNLLYLSGLTGIYYQNKVLNKFLSWTGTVISSIGAILSLALFLDIVTWGSLSKFGPLFLFLYLLNAYLGLKLAKE